MEQLPSTLRLQSGSDLRSYTICRRRYGRRAHTKGRSGYVRPEIEQHSFNLAAYRSAWAHRGQSGSVWNRFTTCQLARSERPRKLKLTEKLRDTCLDTISV